MEKEPESQEMTLFGVRLSTMGFGAVLTFTCLLAMASAGKSGATESNADRAQGTVAPTSGAPTLALNEVQIGLPTLPYAHDALAPYVSKETIDLHYGKHQAGYVTKLNAWLKANPSAINLIRAAQAQAPSSVTTALVRSLPKPSPAYNLAAQIFNHALYFATLARDSPLSRLDEADPFVKALHHDFGDVSKFRDAFRNAAINHFGSGWVWVLANHSSALSTVRVSIVATHDAETPIAQDDSVVPLVVCDVWEHAYYVDYRNDRARYVDSWFEATDWGLVAKRFQRKAVEAGEAATVVDSTYPHF